MDVASAFNFKLVLLNIPFLLEGVKWTLLVSLAGLLCGTAIGLLIAILRLSAILILERIATASVNFFQSTPLLVQLMWLFFALPMITGYAISPMSAGITGLGLYSGAYLSEVFRAGILSIKKGQSEAGRALGMTMTQLFRRIVLPQAAVRILPPMASVWVSTIKESALVSAVAVEELMYKASSLSALSLRPVETLTIAALLYFTITYPFALAANALHQRFLRM